MSLGIILEDLVNGFDSIQKISEKEDLSANNTLNFAQIIKNSITPVNEFLMAREKSILEKGELKEDGQHHVLPENVDKHQKEMKDLADHIIQLPIVPLTQMDKNQLLEKFSSKVISDILWLFN